MRRITYRLTPDQIKLTKSRFTDDQITAMKRLRENGYTCKEIAKQMPDHTPASIRQWFRRQPDYLERWKSVGQQIQNTTIRAHNEDQKRYSPEGGSRIQIPLEVIADRDRRANEYRDPAASLMGDPPPSRSALGRPCQ